jgi:hypothetical protein
MNSLNLKFFNEIIIFFLKHKQIRIELPQN